MYKICSDKEVALEDKNFDKAADLRGEEVKKIQKIIDKLNAVGITKEGILTCEVSPYKSGDEIT